MTILGNLGSVGQLILDAAVNKKGLGIILGRIGIDETSRGGLDTA